MIRMSDAVAAYRDANNVGFGYTPYPDVPGNGTIEEAAANIEDDGWTVVLAWYTDDNVALVTRDGEYVAIGGDASGGHAWAVAVKLP